MVCWTRVKEPHLSAKYGTVPLIKMTTSSPSAAASPEEDRDMQHTTDGSSLGDTANGVFDDGSEPDYDYLADATSSTGDLPSEEPEYYDNLGLDCVNDLQVDESPTSQLQEMNSEERDENIYAFDDEEYGDEYILGTLMVRVLQARNLKPQRNNGGGISGLLFDHRRNRHRSAMSPASAGNLTPSSREHQQTYATLSFRGQTQRTTYAQDPVYSSSFNGDYHWSRGDQSYFDVTCSSYPLKLAQMQQQPFRSRQQTGQPKAMKENSISCATPGTQQQPRAHLLPPTLRLSLYSSKEGHGRFKKSLKKSPSLENEPGSDDYFLGKCTINVLQILTGKNTYFDEWCTLHDESQTGHNNQQGEAGTVRVVIEYEPVDPMPRPGDLCVFANVYPLAKEMHPIPSFSICKTVHKSTSMSSIGASTLTSTSSCSTSNKPTVLSSQLKQFRVEEVVGDHIVLSYQTPDEGWSCTFEVHRYLVLCTHRHQAALERYREHVLDFCDNVSQSPMVETLARTVEVLPDEGLVYVGAGALGGGVSLLGRWWENGAGGMIEDFVDGMNLDGRYSHLSDDDSQSEQVNDDAIPYVGMEQSSSSMQEERTPIPGMPNCPITGLPMIDPVVAADGHTYERHAIQRWFQTSNRSPLTGAVLAHLELVPNYSLLSSVDGLTNHVSNS
mmetsp:Transcript_4041/g.8569  ORF Transcript_4041/g.8569 Transcript_4041/m.8569 type:complete len:669 (+) Transcript_4041:101-2107(+)